MPRLELVGFEPLPPPVAGFSCTAVLESLSQAVLLVTQPGVSRAEVVAAHARAVGHGDACAGGGRAARLPPPSWEDGNSNRSAAGAEVAAAKARAKAAHEAGAAAAKAAAADAAAARLRAKLRASGAVQEAHYDLDAAARSGPSSRRAAAGARASASE